MPLSPAELITIFPEALPDIKRNYQLQKEALARFEEHVPSLLSLYYDSTAQRTDLTPELRAMFNRVFTKVYYKDIHDGLKAMIRFSEELLYCAKSKQPSATPEVFAGMAEQESDFITTEQIERAKRVPITNYLQFNRGGFAKCPWHNEKTPSLKYYKDKNKVHCFGGCNKSWSVIDLVMERYQIDFKKAVLFLTHA